MESGPSFKVPNILAGTLLGKGQSNLLQPFTMLIDEEARGEKSLDSLTHEQSIEVAKASLLMSFLTLNDGRFMFFIC
jgi:hypothetical protein